MSGSFWIKGSLIASLNLLQGPVEIFDSWHRIAGQAEVEQGRTAEKQETDE